MALHKQVAGNYSQRQTRHARCKVQGNLYVIFRSTRKNAPWGGAGRRGAARGGAARGGAGRGGATIKFDLTCIVTAFEEN